MASATANAGLAKNAEATGFGEPTVSQEVNPLYTPLSIVLLGRLLLVYRYTAYTQTDNAH